MEHFFGGMFIGILIGLIPSVLLLFMLRTDPDPTDKYEVQEHDAKSDDNFVSAR